ncbi:Putative FAD-binding domain, FAD/NAD(P)-binding domain superfamily [Septoria linicola]|uniref:FAD-binding domain, FAD/NAD(P)-binding domain superfamily n=1 Tax=Septoria linicola TaxID=215465 RepID=A0A9Q9ARR2_9PEZI|nr:putative FAD-binding domain, FAD/NAD(P)-binding domain superfamily [Septoria linicola]USW50826.1 Putative FAD-binding domain, FAD/NAD(P)-binding domain superfamily [Septoria linicola]
MSVLIVGAGVTGLLFAQGLKRNSIPFAIYEAEEAATTIRGQRDWGMSIQWALPLLQQILPEDLFKRLQTTSVDPHYVFPHDGNVMPVYNVETGELVKSMPLVKMLRVSRRKFRALCAEGIDVKYAHVLTNTKETGTDLVCASFDVMGSSCRDVEGALVVGADGAHSALRSLAFQDWPEQGLAMRMPYIGINTSVCYNDAATAILIRESLSPVFAIGIHPRGYWLWISVQEVPDPSKRETWMFQLQWTWAPDNTPLGTAKPSLPILKAEAAATFAESFRVAWLQIPDDAPILPTMSQSGSLSYYRKHRFMGKKC